MKSWALLGGKRRVRGSGDTGGSGVLVKVKVEVKVKAKIGSVMASYTVLFKIILVLLSLSGLFFFKLLSCLPVRFRTKCRKRKRW